ncbi:DPP IV N-terminal domain-containing protein [Sphingomicrobium aestuariivivum]|uniref:DPP IV N-terminal domain-containing protein n=1 Tax=Sphingomicrobium aestuariivivum TaxID=1582356 RepID=UPI001FD695E2|nr:DPP IV N-terminal domain-containing protein [Sphingomicrobium aestuariivivum]MCJ8189965.1 S9 family peptidase [Sphingomicrobium aestuariivivum]
MRLALLASTILFMTSPAAAEELTLERVFASPDLNGASPRGVKLSPDGSLLTMLRPREDDRQRYDLWALDTASGDWRLLVDSEKVGTGAELSEAEKMQRERARIGSLKGIVSYQWSPDGEAILVPIDGDLYIADLDGGVRRLTETEAGELNPTISPRGRYAAFVREGRLWVSGIADTPIAITPEETSELVHWGEAEFVAQEEMGRRTGYWWSPDERYIAVQRFDESPVGVVTRTSIGGGGTTTFDQRYPAAGTDNVLNELWIIQADGEGREKVDLGEETDIYLARVDWAPDGKALYVQRQNREQTVLDMLKVDPATGKSEILFTETAAEGHWTNLSDHYKFLSDGSLLWWSERDGYGHLWLLDTGSGDWRQLTRGEWVVTDLDGVDEDGGRLYFTANAEGPLETHLYALDYRTPGATPERLTQAGFSYDWSMDKKARRGIVTRSNPSQPPQLYLADNKAERIAWIEENALDGDHPYAPYLDSHEASSFGTIETADGATLHYEMIRPAGMEEGKRYPVFFQHYGGPHVQTVQKDWGGALKQWIVDQGYVWVQLDNRGSDNRGVEFEKAIYRGMGGVEVADQKAGAEWLKTLDFVDPERIATYGWSYGGYMTLHMLGQDPGLYAAGIAGAPVSRWELYDTHYTERYMGDPREVPEAYEAASTFPNAAKIRDPLLLIHGMSDDNVVLDNSAQMALAMQEARVQFDMMFYPGQAHGVKGPQISVHLWETIMRFLEQNGVEGGAR